MNPLDVVAIVLVVLAVLLGYRSGALPQVGGLLGAIGGGAIVVISLPLLVEPLDNVPTALRPYVVLTGLLLAVGVGELLGSTIGRAIAGPWEAESWARPIGSRAGSPGPPRHS